MAGDWPPEPQKSDVIADLFGVTQRRIQQLTKEGVLAAAPGDRVHRYDVVATVQSYISHLATRAKDDSSKSAKKEEERRTTAEADFKETRAAIAALELQELEGKMHRSEDVEAVLTDLVFSMRSMILALPGRLAVDVANVTSSAEASEIIKRECYAILAALANYQYDPKEFKRRVRKRQGWSAVEDEEKSSDSIQSLNTAVAGALKYFSPPEDLTVAEWADKYRVLSPETAAEAGPWRTERTPYLREPMEAFTDPKVHRIVMVAASQVGKSEFEMNVIGYIIDQDPGSVLFVQPTIDDAKKFSRLRVAPMIRDSKKLRDKVSDIRSRDSGNTILQKSFPGGMLTVTGANSASSLASTPARYILGDERDRWPLSAGSEGDPWSLAEARQATFYNRKAVEVSTPTIKGRSNIEASFYLGTQERWCHQCPECGEWHNIIFDHIRFEHEVTKIRGKKFYRITSVGWACPSCGCLSTEHTMRRQPTKWIAQNPDAYANGIRSFWLNAFSSPWTSWAKIAQKFLEAKHDPEKLKVVYNTLLGELWEDRGDLEDEDTMLARREDYPAELPEGVLVLTCGVDTQDNRLEYEVVGHGFYGETWGIKKGYIMAKPDNKEAWERLDDVVDRVYMFANGRGLRISITCVDSGGHYTQDVYRACRQRFEKHVFAIKGSGGEGIPLVRPPTKVPIKDDKRIFCWLYTIGVDAGKEAIMSALKVQESGPKYCHFPRGEDRGYNMDYFNGLLSEKLVLSRTKNGEKWQWQKLLGHTRNEALDCRNYALAGLRIIDPDMDAMERRLKGQDKPQAAGPKPAPRPRKKELYEDW